MLGAAFDDAANGEVDWVVSVIPISLFGVGPLRGVKERNSMISSAIRSPKFSKSPVPCCGGLYQYALIFFIIG